LKRREKLRQSGRRGSKALARMMPFSFMAAGGMPAFLILLSCTLIVISAVRPAMVDGVRTSAADLFAPVLNVVVLPVQTAALFVRDVSGLAAMQSENARLVAENERLREWYQTALLLEAENISLRELLHVKVEPQHKFISARVLSDAGRTFAKSLLISAGAKDGVEKGQAVVSSRGVIGRIIEAGANSSRVLLVTDINSRVPILVEGSSLHAIMSGTNGTEAKLSHLPPDGHVPNGAHIITSGHGGLFPFGLPVGIVQKTENGSMIVKPFADVNRMVHVRVIDTPSDPYLREGALN
jgi:rod shape-determining protein MreC